MPSVFAISLEEIAALSAALDGAFEGLEQIRKTLAELDAMPPAGTPREIETRAWYRAEIIKVQLEMLMPPITICRVLKKLQPNQVCH